MDEDDNDKFRVERVNALKITLDMNPRVIATQKDNVSYISDLPHKECSLVFYLMEILFIVFFQSRWVELSCKCGYLLPYPFSLLILF